MMIVDEKNWCFLVDQGEKGEKEKSSGEVVGGHSTL